MASKHRLTWKKDSSFLFPPPHEYSETCFLFSLSIRLLAELRRAIFPPSLPPSFLPRCCNITSFSFSSPPCFANQRCLSFQCQFCPKTFVNKSFLLAHLRRRHPGREEEEEEEGKSQQVGNSPKAANFVNRFFLSNKKKMARLAKYGTKTRRSTHKMQQKAGSTCGNWRMPVRRAGKRERERGRVFGRRGRNQTIFPPDGKRKKRKRRGEEKRKRKRARLKIG